MQFEYAPGATPIDPDEAAGLIPDYISTQRELNELEAVNIAAAVSWARRTRANVLSSHYARELHKRMFADVWKWAGSFRRSDKNIGLPWEKVPTALEELRRNTKYQIEHEVFPPDELAARFHHGLVSIHCFVNGNGRHARMMTDALLARVLNRPAFSWGNATETGEKVVRDRYIAALRAADRQQFEELFAFVRS